MPPSFSPGIHLALALSYPPWIPLMLIWLQLLKIRAIPYLFMQHSNRYYNKTDHSEVYRIAMGTFPSSLIILYANSHPVLVLHPCHKLKYFRTAGWEEEWIETTHSIVREEFNRTYAFMDVAGEDQANKVC